MVCIACKIEHNDNFCPNCGEKAGIKRLTLPSVLQDAFASITNMDKGLLFNLKNLSLNPQQLITEYIKGRRKGISNPITFLIIATTIYIILETYGDLPIIEASESVNDDSKKSRIYKAGYEAGRLMQIYLKYYWILTVFILTTSTRVMFGKYNFVEHLAINSFILGFSTLLGIIGLVVFEWHLLWNPFIYGIILISLYRVFEAKNDKFGTGVQAFFAVFFFFLQLLLIMLAVGYYRTAT